MLGEQIVSSYFNIDLQGHLSQHSISLSILFHRKTTTHKDLSVVEAPLKTMKLLDKGVWD